MGSKIKTFQIIRKKEQNQVAPFLMEVGDGRGGYEQVEKWHFQRQKEAGTVTIAMTITTSHGLNAYNSGRYYSTCFA